MDEHIIAVFYSCMVFLLSSAIVVTSLVIVIEKQGVYERRPSRWILITWHTHSSNCTSRPKPAWPTYHPSYGLWEHVCPLTVPCTAVLRLFFLPVPSQEDDDDSAPPAEKALEFMPRNKTACMRKYVSMCVACTHKRTVSGRRTCATSVRRREGRSNVERRQCTEYNY